MPTPCTGLLLTELEMLTGPVPRLAGAREHHVVALPKGDLLAKKQAWALTLVSWHHFIHGVGAACLISASMFPFPYYILWRPG